jgi:pyridoxal/pyridoxine/pyridoxamine kinase
MAKPKLPVDFSGTGDVFTTALVINDLRMADFAKAMRKTACSMADICAIRDPDTPQLYPDATGRPSLPLPLAGTALTTPQSRLPLMYL